MFDMSSDSKKTKDDDPDKTRVLNNVDPAPVPVPTQDTTTSSNMKPALCMGGHFQLTQQDAESVEVQLKQEGVGAPQESKKIVIGATCDSEQPVAFALDDCNAEDLTELCLRYKAPESSQAMLHMNFDLKVGDTVDHKPNFIQLLEQRIQSRLFEDNEPSSVRLVPDRLLLRKASDECPTYFFAPSGVGTVLLALPSSHEGGAVRLLPKGESDDPKTIAFGPLSFSVLPQWMAYRHNTASIELQPVTEGVQALLAFRIELVKTRIREPSWVAQRYPTHCRHWVVPRKSSMIPVNPNEPSG